MKVLIVQTKRGIGDGVIFLPYIVAISKKLKTPVSLLTRSSTRSNELIGNNPHIDEIIILDRDDKNNYGRHFGFMGALNLIKDLKEKKFDKSYAFNSSFRYAFITKISGIKECYHYTLGKKKNQNIIEAANSFLFKNLGEKVESNPQLFVEEKKVIEAKNKFKMNNETTHILLGVGGSGSTKRVPAEKFIEFINMLSKDKKCMYYLAAGSGNEEQKIINKIKSSENKNNCVELI